MLMALAACSGEGASGEANPGTPPSVYISMLTRLGSPPCSPGEGPRHLPSHTLRDPHLSLVLNR